VRFKVGRNCDCSLRLSRGSRREAAPREPSVVFSRIRHVFMYTCWQTNVTTLVWCFVIGGTNAVKDLCARQDANHSDTEVSRGLATPHGTQRLAALVSTIAKHYTRCRRFRQPHPAISKRRAIDRQVQGFELRAVKKCPPRPQSPKQTLHLHWRTDKRRQAGILLGRHFSFGQPNWPQPQCTEIRPSGDTGASSVDILLCLQRPEPFAEDGMRLAL